MHKLPFTEKHIKIPEMKKNFKGFNIWIYFVLALILLAFFLLDLWFGSVKIPLGKIMAILLKTEEVKVSWTNILLLFRIPKAITAVLAGAGLAVSGLQMQTLFRNPLAGPTVLGIGSGASLGVAITVLASASGGAARFLEGLNLLGSFSLAVSATLGSAFVLMLVLLVSRRVENIITILILGLLFGYATSAIVNILIHFSIAERIQAFVNWTFGSFGNTTWNQLRIFIPVLMAGLFITQFNRKPLNTLLLGEAYARSMGLQIKRARISIIVTTALLTGTVTAFCGPIAFLGIAIPHLCRSFFNTSDHNILLPTTALTGAIIALAADLISQLPGSHINLPLNSVTALIGTPVVVWVILKKKNIRETLAT